MEYLDARRLTGPNLLWDRPSSILDVGCDEAEAAAVESAWREALSAMLDAVGWREAATAVRPLTGGVSLAFAAPIDALYAATEINEWLWSQLAPRDSGESESLDEAADRIRQAIADESRPGLRRIESAAADHGVSFLWDDDHVSLGLGKGSATWPVDELPDAASLDWSEYHDIPVGIVTGTNGKTTTVRLATHIARTAGARTGVSCTDWIAVDDEIIDRDDWSGPGGARRILRQPGVELAILETARGGLLRRGLGVDRADAAVITNIAEDHLGDFGSRTIDELLAIKWIVSRAVRADGVLVLNADDPLLVEKAQSFDGVIHWFTLDPGNETVTAHIDQGGTAWLRDGDTIVRAQGSDRQPLSRVDRIPITLDGAARHNVANALAAAALTAALGIPGAAIARGLETMTQAANPGRSNRYEVDGATVIVDFAHNPHAMQAVFDMARALPADRRLLAFGQAGDRTDRQIRQLARGAFRIGLDRVIVSELAKYRRGRGPGEVFGLIRDELLDCGADADDIVHVDEEIDALDEALTWARPGDLLIILALARADEVHERLSRL